MTTYLYPSSCGDYYSTNWDKTTYQNQLNFLIEGKGNEFLALQDDRIIAVSLPRKIFEWAKGKFGFEDATNNKKVCSHLLKFIYYGEAQGFIDTQKARNLKDSRLIALSSSSFPQLRKLVHDIFEKHMKTPLSHQPLKEMQATVLEFHRMHSDDLRPCYWNRRNHPPRLEANRLIEFGDVSLELSIKALEQQNPDIYAAWSYLQRAHAVHNYSTSFQDKLWKAITEFLEDFKLDQALHGQQQKIQNVLLSLFSIALQNHDLEKGKKYASYIFENYSNSLEVELAIGEIYLKNNHFKETEPYLNKLAQFYHNRPDKLELIGKVYTSLNRHPEAIECYKNAVTVLKTQLDNYSNAFKNQAGPLYYTIGLAYLNNLEGLPKENNTLVAIEYLEKAFQCDQGKQSYQNKLGEAFILQHKNDQNNFEAQFGTAWLNFMNKCAIQAFPNESKLDFQNIFFTCMNQAHANGQHARLKNYIERGVAIFGKDKDFVHNLLKSPFIKNDIVVMLYEKLQDTWRVLFPNEPLVSEKLADYYWARNNSDLAIHFYKNALTLFQAQNNGDHAVQSRCETIQTKINSHHGTIHINDANSLLKLPFLIPYDEAIEKLKKAVDLKAPGAKEKLFQAYIKAGENTKGIFFNDHPKTIHYYQKAFDVLPQNGLYLKKLFELYFYLKRDQEAANLFLEVQKHSWANTLLLPASSYINLGKQLKVMDPQLHETLIDYCFEKAHTLDPNNKEYKKAVFDFHLNQAQGKAKQGIREQKFQEKIKLFEEALKILSEGLNSDFSQINEIKPTYQKMSVLVSHLIAKVIIQSIEVEVALHEDKPRFRERNKEEIKKANLFFDKALAMCADPIKKAEILYDKANLIDYCEGADFSVKFFEQAYALNLKNPFYIESLASACGVSNSSKADEYRGLLPDDWGSQYSNEFFTWKAERLDKNKSQNVNPHVYSIQSNRIVKLAET